jgi:hypothetical protein
MGLKLIQIPEEIQLVNPADGEKLSVDPITFRIFVIRILNHDYFKAPLDALRAALSIMKALDKAKNPGDPMIIAADDWNHLCRVVQSEYHKIFSEYGSLALIQLMPFFDVILKANDAD